MLEKNVVEFLGFSTQPLSKKGEGKTKNNMHRTYILNLYKILNGLEKKLKWPERRAVRGNLWTLWYLPPSYSITFTVYMAFSWSVTPISGSRRQFSVFYLSFGHIFLLFCSIFFTIYLVRSYDLICWKNLIIVITT